MKNQECKIRTKITNINNNEHWFYPYSIEVNKYSGRYPYSKLCVPDEKHKCQSIQSNVKN